MFNFIKRFFRRFKEYLVITLLLMISLIILSHNDSAGIKPFRSLSLGYFSFITASVNSVSEFFTGNSELDELRKRNAELMLKLNLLREHGLENIKLKNLLEFKDTSRFNLLPASVISKLISKVAGTFILNRGSNDSVAVGMPVITDRGLAGIVTDISAEFCIMKTLLNSDLKITVKNQRSRLDGILNWNGKSLIIKNIPTTYDFKNGDRIISSEYSVIMPPNLPVGLVKQKEKTAAGLLSNVVVEPFVKFNSLDDLFIILLVPSKEVNDLELNLYK